MGPARKQTQSVQDKIIAELEAAPAVSRRIFTDFEDAMIRKYYPTKGAHAIANAIGKNHKQVIGRASFLGIKRV